MTAHHQNNFSGVHWTSDMDDVLRVERAAGKSFSEAVEVVNKAFNVSLTRNAAIGRASRLKLPGRTQPPPKPKPKPTPKPKPKPTPAPATKMVMRAVPVVRANGSVTFRMKPKSVLADAPAIDRIPIEIGPAAVSFFDAKRCHCRWPYGDPRDLETFRFCGETSLEDRSYCAPHQRQSRGQ